MYPKIILILFLFKSAKSACVCKPSNVTSATTKTNTTTLSSIPDSLNVLCDFFPELSNLDDGSYGDAVCTLEGNFPDEELILRKIIATFNGEKLFSDIYNFPNSRVTRVVVLNFGKYYGFTRSIDILNDAVYARVAVYIDMCSGKAIRMFLEIYGYEVD